MAKYTLVKFHNSMYGVKKTTFFIRKRYVSNNTGYLWSNHQDVFMFCRMSKECAMKLLNIYNQKNIEVPLDD